MTDIALAADFSRDGLTRRQLMTRGGAALGLAALAALPAGDQLGVGKVILPINEVLSGVAPGDAAFYSRPDLRIPALSVSVASRRASSDPIFIAPYNAPKGQQAGGVVVDRDGQPIWEHPLANLVTTNLRAQSYRGKPVLTWWDGLIENGHGVGAYTIADEHYTPLRRVQAGNGLQGDLHEFLLTDRGTALLTAYAYVKVDLSGVGGPNPGTVQDAIFQELDLESGKVLLEWHSLDHIPITESFWPIFEPWDYFHINSIDVDLDGNLLINSRNTHTVYKIDRSNGEVIWRLGGKSNDFAMATGSAFAWQHDARRQPDGTLTVFDNGATPVVERLSRGLILDVDERAMSATLLAQYRHPGILAGSQGSVQLLPNGNVFVGWGEVPRVSEFLHSGTLVFDAELGEKYESYRAFRMPWTGTPAQAPALALTGGGRGLTAYASWNGATEVRGWQLLAGSDADSLSPVASTRATGFEGALRAGSSGPYFAVNALDRWGRTLGSSSVLTITS